MRLILTLVVLGFPLLLLAQPERPTVPPSPNASAMARHANIQVGYYTGVPSISVPLGVLPGKGVSIPVSLDYHASGIKVQDVAGSAGLGFNLNTGGVITRMARGLPDGVEENCNSGTSGYWELVNGNCDGERDIFYFSMLGRSGKMFMDDDGALQLPGTPRLMPYQDLVVKRWGGLDDCYWTITDESGYSYYFGEDSESKESTTYFTGHDQTFTEKFTYTSSWYLTKILSPSGEEVATFVYDFDDNRPIQYDMYHQVGVDPDDAGLSITHIDTRIRVNQPKYIYTITTDLGSFVFNYIKNREDLSNGWQLNTVLLKDGSGLTKRTFYLDIGYFKDIWDNNIRLRLDAIREGFPDASPTYTFLYNELGNNPSRENFFYDDYGYFNDSSPPCTPSSSLPANCNDGVQRLPGGIGDRQVFTLSEIINVTGGRTIFEYESSSGRGLRIKSISNMLGAALVAKSSFTYGGAFVASVPVYSYTSSNGTVVWSSSSFKELFDLNGTNVGHTSVTETFLDGSKIKRRFTNFSDFPDIAPTVAKYYADPPASTPILQNSEDENGPPFSPTTTRFWMRGLPKSIKILDAQGNVLQIDSMTYDEGGTVASAQNTAIHNFNQNYGSDPNITYVSGLYTLYSRPVYLLRKHSYFYDQSDFTKAAVKITDFLYHGTYKTFPSSITSYLENGPQEKVNFRYDTDVIGSATEPSTPQELAAGIWALKNKHIITPVEKLVHLKDWGSSSFKIVGGTLFTFKKGSPNEQPLVKEIHELAIDNPITSMDEASLISAGNTFSYDARYRLLKSFQYNESANTLSQVSDYQGITNAYSYINNTLMSSSAILINGVQQYKTAYDYNTINGIEKITDMNNLSTRFTYDNMGRLKLIKDNDSNILSRYRYNIGGVSDYHVDFSASKSTAIVGQSINFQSVMDNENVGSTKYLWDYADGFTLEGTSKSSDHTYASPGSFAVMLRKVNPEYGTITSAPKTITIYAAPSVSINTCSAIDLCSTQISCNLTASGAGGCPTMTYKWYYSTNNGVSWSQFATVQNPLFSPGSVGTYKIKCVVTDGCTNTAESSHSTIEVYESTQGCPQH